jgi:hypothetical protein
MEEKNALELRDTGRHYRELSDFGNDPTLNAALLELADDFEQEAAKLDGQSEGMTQRPTPSPNLLPQTASSVLNKPVVVSAIALS